MLLLVWVHGCIGLHFWLRIRPWYVPIRGCLFALALLLPGLALAGFHLGGREVQAIAAHDPAWLDQIALEQRWPDAATKSWFLATEKRVLGVFLLVLALIVGARLVRDFRDRAAGKVQLRYLDGSNLSIEPGMTVLDGSRSANIPHASVCGGRGRCSTCRVRVGAGAEHLPPVTEDEEKVLNRIGADEGIRLALSLIHI